MSGQTLMATTQLDFPCDVPGKRWVLAAQGEFPDGDCLVAAASEDGDVEVVGRYDGKTGCVLALGQQRDDEAPAVLNVGSVDAESGQLKARQPHGNYLRVCRWDRIGSAPKMHPNAAFRTLPQCGCGGYLGVPKFFDTFAEMSAYVYCMFYLQKSTDTEQG